MTKTKVFSLSVSLPVKQISHHDIAMLSGKHVRVMYTPVNPTLNRKKLGYAGVYLFFLFLLQNIDCGYSLEPPRPGYAGVYFILLQNIDFLQPQKNLYTAWACFRNVFAAYFMSIAAIVLVLN